MISGLNRTAFGLAVYASQGRLPAHHARLASGCWPGSAGRDWLPAGFRRKVSHLWRSPFPELLGAMPVQDRLEFPPEPLVGLLGGGVARQAAEHVVEPALLRDQREMMVGRERLGSPSVIFGRRLPHDAVGHAVLLHPALKLFTQCFDLGRCSSHIALSPARARIPWEQS